MVDWLTKLVQEMWKTGHLPQEWKNATLVPLLKKKDRRVCDNYPSLLSVPGKVMALIHVGEATAHCRPSTDGGPVQVQEGTGHCVPVVGHTAGGRDSNRIQDPTAVLFCTLYQLFGRP